MEEQKKRKAEEKLTNYRKRLQVRQHMEKKSLEDFRFANRYSLNMFSCLYCFVKLWLIIPELVIIKFVDIIFDKVAYLLTLSVA